MKLIIPMAGRGDRFIKAGFSDIKPLIPIDGIPLIEQVLRMFPGETNVSFICAADHLKSTNLEAELKRLAPRCQIVSIAPHKLGPVWTLLQGQSAIDDGEPTFVSYCDYTAYWNYPEFLAWLKRENPDGVIPSYRGFHPHSLGPNLYAYLRTQGDRVLEIKEKGAFTDNRMEEFASAGGYYFKSGKLLKKYCEKLVEKKITTKDEYFASLPFNFMIQDGLDVRAYELEHFVQLGTPEDVWEYAGWSNWFLEGQNWKPTQKIPGTLVVPMAGEGRRFQEQGYKDPKPFIPVDGKGMLSRSLHTTPLMERAILIHHQELKSREKDLNSASPYPKTEKICLTDRTQGQLDTCLKAKATLDPKQPLAIVCCDTAVKYPEEELKELINDKSVDFVVWTFRNHPHANRNPKQYGWVAADRQGNIQKIACKSPISATPEKDPGVVGWFWFRSASLFFEAAHEMIQKNDRVNGEFYVDVLASRLAEKGRKGKILDVDHYICFGTPNDTRTYEYWASYFRKLAIDTRKKARA